MRNAMIANQLYQIKIVDGSLVVNEDAAEGHVDHDDRIITVADDGGTRLDLIARGVRIGIEAAMAPVAATAGPVWGGDIEPMEDDDPPFHIPVTPDAPDFPS